MTNKINEISRIRLSKPESLVLADRRLFNYLLHHAFSSSQKRPRYEMDLEKLSGVFSPKPPDIDRLLLSFERLLQVTLTVEYHSGKNHHYTVLNLLSDLQVDTDKKRLIYAFSKTCRAIFNNPELLERCLIQAHFEYKYTESLYTLLVKQAFSSHAQKPVIIDLSFLRESLDIDENKFKNYNDLLRFVLKPALDELNWYASFTTSFETISQGRKVIALQFFIKNKRKITTLKSSRQVVPIQRPKLFFEDPMEETAYTYLLNASTSERKKQFNIAIKNAEKKRKKISTDSFDTPDTWFEFCKKELIKQLD